MATLSRQMDINNIATPNTVNVIRGLEDPFYRYTMERLQTKIEGNGNGIKTVLTNMDKIAKSLNRPASYPTKYFGCELGAQTHLDDKNARYIVNGAHEAGKLSELLDDFIKKFVLCPSCNNPETDLAIDRNDDILRICKACGKRNMVDMRHKLTTFIVNNPPSNAKKESGKKMGTTHIKEEKRYERREKAVGKKKIEDESEEDPDIEAPPIVDLRDGLDLEEDWGDDVSEEATQQRNKQMMSLNEKLEKLAVSGSDSEAEDPTMIQVIESSKLLTHPEKITLVLASVLFDDDRLSSQWIVKHAPILHRYATNPKAQRNVLIGIERALVQRAVLMAKIPIFFKALYDKDVVEENTFIKWSQKTSSRRYVPRDVSKLVHEKAKVFVDWLENAEEESSNE
jgi:translation initiation factor 5